MTWILTTIFCIVLVEIVIRIPFLKVLLEINTISRKALFALGAKSVSDHWKEKVMLAYAGLLFSSTMKLAGFMIVIGVTAILLIFLFDFFGVTIVDFIVSWVGILFSLVVATVYFKIRNFFV